MIILTIRTDKPEAEIGVYDDKRQLAYETWLAHRTLAESLHARIRDMLKSKNIELSQVGAIVCYKGPGSFTGLRIGLTVGNALAYGLNIPIVSETDNEWLQKGIARLMQGENESAALPAYGADVHITLPKH